MLDSLFNKIAALGACNFIKKRLQCKCFSVSLRNFSEHIFYGAPHVATLLLVLQVYLHQIINLNTNILKVFQVSLQIFLG